MEEFPKDWFSLIKEPRTLRKPFLWNLLHSSLLLTAGVTAQSFPRDSLHLQTNNHRVPGRGKTKRKEEVESRSHVYAIFYLLTDSHCQLTPATGNLMSLLFLCEGSQVQGLLSGHYNYSLSSGLTD